MKILIIKTTKDMKRTESPSAVKASRMKDMKEAIRLASKNMFLTF